MKNFARIMLVLGIIMLVLMYVSYSPLKRGSLSLALPSRSSLRHPGRLAH